MSRRITSGSWVGITTLLAVILGTAGVVWLAISTRRQYGPGAMWAVIGFFAALVVVYWVGEATFRFTEDRSRRLPDCSPELDAKMRRTRMSMREAR